MELSNYQIKEGGGNGGNKEFDLIQLSPTVQALECVLQKSSLENAHFFYLFSPFFVKTYLFWDFKCIMVCHIHN